MLGALDLNLLELLYRLLIYPPELLCQVIFAISERIFDNTIISIIVLSIVVNIFCFPLYRRADSIQEEASRELEAIRPWSDHIRKTFRGDERFMMLQTYYRQSGYSPTHSLKMSASLLLQIPIFIAAYHFLSHLSYVDGVSLGPISDIGKPDGLIRLGGVTINFLPILMTVINITAGMIYSHGHSVRERVQVFALAAIFLVLLYDSKAALVFYWTLNNFFSLCKNVLIRLGVIKMEDVELVSDKSEAALKGDKRSDHIFILGALFLTFFIGVMIPSQVVSSSPQDFISVIRYRDPMDYVIWAGVLGAGVFVIWTGIYYLLASHKWRKVISAGIWVISAVSVLNYLTLDNESGAISSEMTFDRYVAPGSEAMIVNLLNIIIVMAVCLFVWKYKRNTVPYIMGLLALAAIVMSFMNIRDIRKVTDEAYYLGDRYSVPAEISFSTRGKNVIVIMLDRADGNLLPYIMNANPELEAQFGGFVYYPNAISFGPSTYYGAPSLFGGYDYVPLAMNARSDEHMTDKVDESLKVMPAYFADLGYDVVVCDPPYAGGNNIPDLSIYDDIGDINVYYMNGAFSRDDEGFNDNMNDMMMRRERNMFCYGLTKCAPSFLQSFIYDEGDYNCVEYTAVGSLQSNQLTKFRNSYLVLQNLDLMTGVVDDDSDHFLMLTNNSTHDIALLNSDIYEGGITAGDSILNLDDPTLRAVYQINEASLKALGGWFDYLRQEGVYDNCRIIITSDHGYGDIDMFGLQHAEGDLDTEFYNCIMLMKDFDSEGFTIDTADITNADTPYLATIGIGDGINPYTLSPFSSVPDSAVTVIFSREINPISAGENTYSGCEYYTVSHPFADINDWHLEE